MLQKKRNRRLDVKKSKEVNVIVKQAMYNIVGSRITDLILEEIDRLNNRYKSSL